MLAMTEKKSLRDFLVWGYDRPREFQCHIPASGKEPQQSPRINLDVCSQKIQPFVKEAKHGEDAFVAELSGGWVSDHSIVNCFAQPAREISSEFSSSFRTSVLSLSAFWKATLLLGTSSKGPDCSDRAENQSMFDDNDRWIRLVGDHRGTVVDYWPVLRASWHIESSSSRHFNLDLGILHASFTNWLCWMCHDRLQDGHFPVNHVRAWFLWYAFSPFEIPLWWWEVSKKPCLE